jgi:membrane protein DedA with SNARE-associated domain
MSIEHFIQLIASYGYPAIFFLLVLGIVGLPVPDETLLTLTGYLIFKGTLHFIPSFFSAFLGTLCGISLSYAIGRFGGVRLLMKYGARLHLTQERMDHLHAWFRRWGHWSLTVGYFVPGVRHVVAIVAGSSSLEFGTFAFFTYLGAFFWVGLFICTGYYLGEGWNAFPEMMRRIAIALFVVVLAASAVFWFIRSRRTKRLG